MKNKHLLLGLLLISLCIGATDTSNPISCIGEKLGCKTDEMEAYKGMNAVFVTAAKEVTPVLAGPLASLSIISFSANWNSGSPIYELYGVLKDGGFDGYFNFYTFLERVDMYFDQIYKSGEQLEASTAIDAPFDVGFNGITDFTTYDTIFEELNDHSKSITYARVDENEVIYILNVSGDSSGDKDVTQGWYNQSTGDLEIGLMKGHYVVDISSPEYTGCEIVRSFISGNTETHMFTLKLIRNGVGYDHNVTGYGISQGTGSYFLMEMANDTMDFNQANYYLINAEASLADLQAMDDAGSATVPEGDTNNYSTQLGNIVNYVESDLPTANEISVLDIFSF